MLAKPGKWGLLLRCLCDSKTGYCICMVMVQHGIKVSNKKLFKKLFKGFPKKKFKVAMDNFYTSKDVIKFLKFMKYPFVGTIRLNRCGVDGFPKIEPEGYLTIPKNENDR